MSSFELRNDSVSFIKGMHEGIEPELLEGTQYARGLNISSRGGLVHTRPAFVLEDALGDVPEGKFQGAALYRLEDADRIIFCVAGVIYGYNTSTSALVNYTDITGVSMSSSVDHVYFVKAEKFFIVQDGENRALIINYNDDPDNGTQASGTEVPLGTIMAYGQGRLFVVLTELESETVGPRFFAAGDIFLPNDPTSLLNFTEVDYLSGGGAFALPNELGFIRGMAFLQNARSGAGQGSLIVFARSGASSFSVIAPRNKWADNDISTVVFQNTGGTLSPYSVTAMNNDLLFRGVDGLRTVGYTLATTGGETPLSNLPMSSEVNSIFRLDSESDLPFTSASFVDSRAIITAAGQTDESGQHYFRSLISLDGATVSKFGKPYIPIYDGFWTGLKFLHVVPGLLDNIETNYLFAKGDDDRIKLYHMDPTGNEYYDGSSESRSNTLCRLYMRSFDFGYALEKAVSACDVWISDAEGPVTVTAYYRPTGHPLWNSFNSATINISDGSLGQIRRRIRLTPSEEFVCDQSTNDNMRVSETMQFCIEWTGKAKVRRVTLHCQKVTKSEDLGCSISEEEVDLQVGDAGFELDDFEYEVAT